MISRRRMLAGSLMAGLYGIAAPAANAVGTVPWRNWSGSQTCLPSERIAPATLEELQGILANGAGPVRPVGAGHSFSPLVPTDGTLVSLPANSSEIIVDQAL